MKVEITYLLRIKKEIEMSPIDYCELHASTNYAINGERIFPEDSFDREINLSPEAKKELNHFFFEKNK